MTQGRKKRDRSQRANGSRKSGQDRIRRVRLARLRPSPENDEIYRPVDPDDPEIIRLAESIAKHGVREPLVVTSDFWILSGHRRYAAAKLAGLDKVPVRVEPFRRAENRNLFIELLRENNRQRDKTIDEKLREEIVSADPEEAYRALIAEREQRSELAVDPLKLRGEKRRARITAAKQPMLDAIDRILYEKQRKFWPLTVRRIHYALLNDPPLIHASKPHSTYRNDKDSYRALCDLLTRARLEGTIPMEAIDDETRPVTIWNVHGDPRGFIRQELGSMFKGYWRDLMQSQPNHIEIVVEKNTVDPIIRPVAARFRVPVTSGRGYSSIPPRRDLVERYRKSGKDKLVLLMMSDFDPDGEEIAHSFARSLRDDFGVDQIHPIKVALTAKQVKDFDLPPEIEAKESSSNHDRFTREHGKHVFELEALAPEQMQELLREALDSVIDTELFNAEIRQEKQDAGYLSGIRATVHFTLQSLNFDDA